ncbi:uncharacterized protein [Gossypium hirsutum]|uniref:CCHC-type domain-containing protein n=1 Tax=Gossypium hirsutum TaxID=3635 RepID=A0A1U8NAC3_GOSHI|nr:uncharacterized protein LOC107946249 [Gossypium hirsutum]
MLRILERVVGPNIDTVGHGSVTERLCCNGAEIFRGIARVAPNVAEYWIKPTERLMDDLDNTLEQKLKGAVSQLRDEAYQWWLTVKGGTQPDRLTREFFKTGFQSKYVGASYVDAQRKEILDLTQGEKSVSEYEAEDGLKDSLWVLIALQRERDFAALVDKAKITKKLKRAKRQNRKKERGRNKRDVEPSNSFLRPKKKARVHRPVRVQVPIVAVGPQPCTNYGRHHQGKCWKRIGACLRCGSLEHRIRDCP